MKVGKKYIVDSVEYLVLDGTSGRMPGQAGLELLADRGLGVGAEYVMVFTGTEQEPSFLLYRSDGQRTETGREAYGVLARYLRDNRLAPNVSEMVHYLGERALAAGTGQEISCVEVRMTEFFWGQVLRMDSVRAVRAIA